VAGLVSKAGRADVRAMKARYLRFAQSLERDIQFQEEMMRSRSWKWAGLPSLVLVLGLTAPALTAKASPVVNYSTSGTIDSTGVSGTPVIGFNSILNSSFASPSQFSLGAFQEAALPDGQTTTYTNTPFHITYLVNTVDGNTPDPNQTPIQVSGVLNGTVTGGNQSQVTASFNPITSASFLTGPFDNTLTIANSPLLLVPSTTNNGQTSAQAFLTSTNTSTSPVPEPSTIALFLTTLAGLGVQRYRRRRAA
jgi:hypothetical protein